MSRVEKDEMTKLRTAGESFATSLTAEDEAQLASVAYAINSAANTGLTRAVFQEELRSTVKVELESKGYQLSYIKAGNGVNQAVISWKPSEDEG